MTELSDPRVPGGGAGKQVSLGGAETSNGIAAGLVVVADTVTATDYFTGTLDASINDIATIPDFEQYTSVILKLAGVPGGVVIGVTGDVTEDQSGVWSTSTCFRANNVAQSNGTANINLTNGTFVRDWGMHFSQLRLSVAGTLAAGTVTYHLVCKK